MQRILSAFALIFLLCLPAFCDEKAADWIGIQPEDAKAPGAVVFSKTFNLDFDPLEAHFKFTCYTAMDYGGTHYRAFVNGAAGVSGSYWPDVQYMDISKVLRKGGNRVDIEVNWIPMGAPGPTLAKIVAKGKDKDNNDVSVIIHSDETWRYSSGEFDFADIGNADLVMKNTVVIGNANSWQPAKSPQVLPKFNTSNLVGVTNIKLNTGNAGSFFQYDFVRDFSDKFYFLKALGFRSIEDYIFGHINYQQPGQWFWGYDKQIAYNHITSGFEFTPNPWVWIPSDWYVKKNNPSMARCIEHNQDSFALSLWDPQLLRLNEDIYADLKANLGDSVGVIYPGIYGDFGEANYVAGLNPWLSPKPEHQHAGFWAGDDLAKSDFKDKMIKKYGTLEAVNLAWKTSLASIDEIAYPKLDGADSPRYALDFINWYYDSMTDLTLRICTIAKRHFPDIPITAKLGCVDENPMWGQDNSVIPEQLAKIGVGICSTHGIVSNFAMRRISSACKFYGNRFETESTSATGRQDAAKKLFIDASSGCAGVFEYPNSMLEIADVFSKYRRNLRAEHSITEIALFYPTSWHRCNLRQANPPNLTVAAEEIRDILDYDVVDENMALDGALDKYRVIAMFDGNFTESSVYKKLYAWIEQGGTLLLRAEQLPIINIEGSQLSDPELMERAKSGDVTLNEGKGKIIIWSGKWEQRQDYYQMIYGAAYSTTDKKSGGIDGNQDNVWTSLFKDYALYLNNTDSPITVSEAISEDIAGRVGLNYLPQYLKYKIEIPAKSHAVHFFSKPFIEFALECEDMKGAEKHPIDVVYRGGYGTAGRAVRLQNDNYIMTTFRVDSDGEYGFCCVADPADGSPVQLEIDGKPAGIVNGPAGYHKYMYPLNAKLRLKRGKHMLVLRFGSGRSLADKVIITNDTDLAGFAYGFIDPQADQAW